MRISKPYYRLVTFSLGAAAASLAAAGIANAAPGEQPGLNSTAQEAPSKPTEQKTQPGLEPSTSTEAQEPPAEEKQASEPQQKTPAQAEQTSAPKQQAPAQETAPAPTEQEAQEDSAIDNSRLPQLPTTPSVTVNIEADASWDTPETSGDASFANTTTLSPAGINSSQTDVQVDTAELQADASVSSEGTAVQADASATTENATVEAGFTAESTQS